MKLLIGIATYKRISKLQRLLDSLYDQTYKNFKMKIVCDNQDFNTKDYFIHKYPDIDFKVQIGHQFVIGAWNEVIKSFINKEHWDGFIGLVDDVCLEPDALEQIVKCHKDNFPDGDGVCGFNQECPGHSNYTFKWFGQTLMGRKFIERYKEADYQICCPDYFHFCQDFEMWSYANSLRKFKNCEEAVLDHNHPGFTGDVDETHNIIRSGKASPKEFDFLQQFKREQAGLLWGKDFKLLGGKDE